MAVDDGQIFLFHFTTFPKPAQFPRRIISFRCERHAAGFAIQPIDQMRTGALAQVQPHSPDETGHRAILARMTNQIRRLIDGQQFRILMDDMEQVFQATILAKREPKSNAFKSYSWYEPA